MRGASQGPRIGLPLSARDASVEGWELSSPYACAIRKAGGTALPISPLSDHVALDAYLDKIDGLLLYGGGDLDPRSYGQSNEGLSANIDLDRDRCELYLVRRSFERRLPVLGICRGLQVMNVAAGGTLLQDLGTQRPSGIRHRTPPDEPRDTLAHDVSPISCAGVASLARLGLCAIDELSPVPVNSTHHQAADRIGSGLLLAARAEDGIIEMLVSSLEGYYCLGVQWHPEELTGPGHHDLHQRLFSGLVQAAAQWREAEIHRGHSG